MATLPATGGEPGLLTFVMKERPSLTHRLDIARKRVSGTTDGRDAMLQAVYLILGVERYAYPIYSRSYGTELSGLIGKPVGYAMSEVKRRITEALEQDDRITGVEHWDFQASRGKLLASFTVSTIYGEVEAGKEVDI